MLLTAHCGPAVYDQLAQYLLNVMPMALLTGNYVGNMLKSLIYFQHPVSSTNCINYELHHL